LGGSVDLVEKVYFREALSGLLGLVVVDAVLVELLLGGELILAGSGLLYEFIG
jgi:hypothetical protein